MGRFRAAGRLRELVTEKSRKGSCMKKRLPFRKAITDPNLLGGSLPGESYRKSRVMLIGAFGEPLDAEEAEIFSELTGGRKPPRERADEVVLV
jgi:hypothetical protein